MVSPEERIARMEGVIEQISERLGSLDERMTAIEQRTSLIMERKADKAEVRLYFLITVTLFAVTIGLIGAVLTKL